MKWIKSNQLDKQWIQLVICHNWVNEMNESRYFARNDGWMDGWMNLPARRVGYQRWWRSDRRAWAAPDIWCRRSIWRGRRQRGRRRLSPERSCGRWCSWRRRPSHRPNRRASPARWPGSPARTLNTLPNCRITCSFHIIIHLFFDWIFWFFDFLIWFFDFLIFWFFDLFF